MASKYVSIEPDICLKCGKKFDILNNDFEFSLDLHNQTHKTLEEVGLQTTSGKDHTENDISNLVCPECNERVEIFNKDKSLSLRLHYEKHTSSGMSRNSEVENSFIGIKEEEVKNLSSCGVREGEPYLKSSTNWIDDIFNSLLPEFKPHRDFIVENAGGEAFCIICEQIIESMLSIAKHIKTKLHEDRVIFCLKKHLPNELHQKLELVSFNGSNLWCNLCSCKIDLCSQNMYKTIVHIVVHNESKEHLNNVSASAIKGHSSESLAVVDAFCKIDPTFKINKQYIEHNMTPKYQCILCKKHIPFSPVEKILFRNFLEHFLSAGHAESVLKSFKTLTVYRKEEHDFTLFNFIQRGQIYCTVCKCFIEVNHEQLLLHTKSKSSSFPNPSKNKLVQDLNRITLTNTNVIEHCNVGSVSAASNNLTQNLMLNPLTSTQKHLPASKKTTDLVHLLKDLPESISDVSCIFLNNKGKVSCSICNCEIPETIQNLTHHLLGRRHKTNVSAGNHVIPIVSTKDARLNSQTGSNSTMKSNNMTNTLCMQEVTENLSLDENSTTQCHLDKEKLKKKRKSKASKDKQKVVLENLIQCDKTLNNFVKCLTKKDDYYICKYCETGISLPHKEYVMKRILVDHMTSDKHCKKYNNRQLEVLSKITNTLNENKCFRQQHGCVMCLLCISTVSAETEEECLMADIMLHLNESTHLINKLKALGTHEEQLNGFGSSATGHREYKTSFTCTGNNSFKQILEKVANSYQNDETFSYCINNEEGDYFYCSACDVVINLHYLREHLEEKHGLIKEVILEKQNLGKKTKTWEKCYS